MTDSDSNIVYIPAGKRKSQAISIDMNYWGQLEARIQEMAAVTPQKAPELLATFNRAALELDRLANTLELEHQLAVREAERTRGEVLLDKVPAILKSRGLATDRNPMGSEDLRNAVLSQDLEYQEAMDRADMLKAMTKMIRGKFDAFSNAFRAVRTMVGESTFNFSNKNLSGDTGTDEVGITPRKTGFGTPRY